MGVGVTSRKVFKAAALIETSHGPGYTFDDIAASMSVDHQTVLAYNRNYSRTAKAWEEHTGTSAPIKFIFDDSDQSANPDQSARSCASATSPSAYLTCRTRLGRPAGQRTPESGDVTPLEGLSLFRPASAGV